MKVLLVVLVSVSVVSAATYNMLVQQLLPDLPVTKFDYPSFVERNYSIDEHRACSKLRHYENGELVGNRSDDNILDILKSLGGAPGEVEARRKKEVSEAAVEDSDKRPLEDAPEDKWLYDYRVTDYRFYYRLEHAVKRFVGTDKEFLDIRGELAWTPEDTCGRMKIASYRQDDTGFSSKVKTDYCNFEGSVITCATIPYCRIKENGDIVCIG